MQDIKQNSLPENAFRELNAGETYKPVMSPVKSYKEVTLWSVMWGVVMAVIFSAAAAYLGLKVGQVFEVAIPVAIIAVGLSNSTRRKNSLGENVIIQSIGSCSGSIVAGAIFTLPALYILNLHASFMQIFLSSMLGGVLGILFLIPFRKYFVADMHGKYPFPEATATTQVLISGEGSDNQTKPLIIAGVIGGLYDFILSSFGWWSEVLTTRILPFGDVAATKIKTVFKLNTGAAVLGLGYIVGLKYCLIICAGSIFVWFIIIPVMGAVFHDVVLSVGINDVVMTVGEMQPEQIFAEYARYMGIGGIAMAGVIGIVRSWGVVKGAVLLAWRELKGKSSAVAFAVLRTNKDLTMRFIAISVLITLVAIFLFFYFGIIDSFLQAIIAFVMVSVISFLFTTVAANAIAIVGTNPVSGMTLMTLVLASAILVSVGLTGERGMVAALIIGGVVCTALSMSGSFITDLKVGYWLGSTPKKQETWKFLGTLVSALTVGGVILILNKTYGFTEGGLAAPQANAMVAVIEPMMSGKDAPWILYGIGALIVVILTVFKVPALAFALGMFIPLELNTPLIIGGLISWFVSTHGKDEKQKKARYERGTLLASGLIAGGALMGVVSAALRFGGFHYISPLSDTASQSIGLVLYLVIVTYLLVGSMRAKSVND
ncbi:MAG: oligopeptide transporter, OPT family [Bacteroidales bacterium]